MPEGGRTLSGIFSSLIITHFSIGIHRFKVCISILGIALFNIDYLVFIIA